MLIRFAYGVYRMGSATRHWIERRFTKGGLLVLASLVATLSVGIDIEHTISYQLCALLAALLVFAMASAIFFRGRFDVQRFLPRYGTAGQPLVYRIRVRSRGKRILRGLELLEDLADPRPDIAEFAAMHQPSERARSFRLAKLGHRPPSSRPALARFNPLPALAADGGADITARIVPLRRGVLRFSGVTLARPDPFGLFRGFVTLSRPESVVILPKRYPLPPIVLPGATRYQQGGVALASSVGESEEFVSLRDYRPGDPLRRVHWRSLARAGRLIVREYQQEFFVRHALVLDTFARPAQSAALEEAVSVAASFACAISTQESLLDVMFVGAQAVCLSMGRGLAHTEQALEILASVRPCQDKSVEALRDLIAQHAQHLSGCICILLDWDAGRQDLVRDMQTLGVPLLTFVVAEGQRAATIRTAAAESTMDVHVLEVGRIAEDLANLEGRMVTA